ncbi:NADH-quinone oxidoreductase subunit G [Constrictibacter sp. MBR-5]|jgi:NADH-quinone oxidoreductase subunit G|uniref:NADH-quinone oxidoreductase subunit NuoG n=1 Tax=Constrictibacter sp. MBR-5 TaxID=3156467 RepID=UPI003393ADD9
MPKLKVDGIEVEVPPGSTVLQACEAAGKEIPRFCYHERLSIAGNCRMCLVEIKPGPPKPAASCAMPAGENMEVFTESAMVLKARKGVMEFLLINHPLDCPICDQGGECDLQDQAMGYGMDHSRFAENKRAVPDKYMGPLIKTIMTRCIHCTRCVRFVDEVAGMPAIGGLFRGEHMEISSLERAVTSELSGNVIDLCPVGALTSKPYAFAARPWELRKTETVDVLDALGSSIRVDSRGMEVLRVLPRINEEINEEWISDKTRFAYDGLKRQRLDRPYVRRDGKLRPATWDEAFAAIATRLKGLAGDRFAAIAGDLADCESMVALKDLATGLGSTNIDCRQDGAKLDPGVRAGYVFNAGLAGIEAADAILLVGTNPRFEAPVLNARIRKRWKAGALKVGVLGPQADLTYRYDYLGAGAQTLADVGESGHAFLDVLKNAERPLIVVGQGALARPDGAAVLAACRALAESVGAVGDEWNGFAVLHTAAARVGGLDLGFVPRDGGRDVEGILQGCESGEVEVVYLLGADEFDTSRLGNAFVIYQGHHGDAGAHRADVVLPGAAYTEKNGIYVNTEGRVQYANRAIFPPGEAREDWTIVRALSGVLGAPLPYDNLDQVRQRLVEVNDVFAHRDELLRNPWGDFGTAGAMQSSAFASPVTNFYMTDPISRASETMARCTAEFQNRELTGTDG